MCGYFSITISTTLNATDDDQCWFLLSIVLAGECNGRYGTRLVKLYIGFLKSKFDFQNMTN